MKIGALEAGGTKMVCAVGDEHGTILEQMTFDTETPATTIPQMIAYFKNAGVEALGIGCFGPIDLDRTSSTYGYITSTPKLAWQNCDMVGAFGELNVPIGFDTDVNASALGEATYGATQGLHSSLYITVGTGIGVGVYLEGKLVHGMLHPEAGHVLITKDPSDAYHGKCPFHAACLEGLASGPAIEERWGMKGLLLAHHSEVWELEATYLAQAITNYILLVAPQRIVLGGGVMKQTQLFPLIRTKVKDMLNGYLQSPLLDDMDSYIVPAGCNDKQGVLGCLQLGYRQFQSSNNK